MKKLHKGNENIAGYELVPSMTKKTGSGNLPFDIYY